MQAATERLQSIDSIGGIPWGNILPQREWRSPLLFEENTMLTSSLVGRSRPVGVLLGGSGISRAAMQHAPQVRALLLCQSQNGQSFSGTAPAISIELRLEADHAD
jgi:hypothetical protein